MDVRYQILVLEPTFQRANELHKMIVSVGGNISHLCVGGSKGMSYEAVPRISNAFFPIVVGTPGHLIDLMERKVLNPSRVGLVVLGETSALLNNKFGAHTADIFQRLTSKDVQFVYFSDIPVICADGQATSEYLKDPIRITIEKEQIETDGIEEQSLFVGDQDDDERPITVKSVKALGEKPNKKKMVKAKAKEM
ncbi:Eukaryotic initiation factor 4A-II [Entomortierella beljakovae]|nr:Eukaryotic initiation factor 4A-II [Entomortierella beljakovae]